MPTESSPTNALLDIYEKAEDAYIAMEQFYDIQGFLRDDLAGDLNVACRALEAIQSVVVAQVGGPDKFAQLHSERERATNDQAKSGGSK